MQTKAIYTGSFDPLTNGHMNIITRAARLYDELTVGIISNPSKVPQFPIEEPEIMIAEALRCLPNVRVDHFSGLLADFVNRNGFNVVVRGLRGGSDFEYELQMAQTNRKLAPDVDTTFLYTSLQYSFLSSTIVKEVVSFGGDISEFVPDYVAEMMHRKYGQHD